MAGSAQSFSVFLGRLQQNDEQAWNELRRRIRSQASLYPSLAGITPDDLTQDVLIAKHQALPTYQPQRGRGTVAQNFGRWIQTNVRNAYDSHYRRERRLVSLPELEQGLNLPQGWQEQLSRDARVVEQRLFGSAEPRREHILRRLVEVIQRLDTPKKRLAAFYHFVMGYTIKETATLLDEHPAAMNTLLMRNIKDELRQLGLEPDDLTV